MYTFTEKIDALKDALTQGLLPLIGKRKCAYMDLPYHVNIGDTLIWEGTEHFLRSNHIACVWRNGIQTYYRRSLSRNTLILIHGGGSFGDLWWEHQLRPRIIQDYPDNPIIVLPQTVYYADKDKMLSDAAMMARHPDLTLCARDQASYRLLTTYFSANRIVLLPDMAFYIPPETLMRYVAASPSPCPTLLLKRTDKELADFDLTSLPIDPNTTDVRDWPTLEGEPRCMNRFKRLNHKCRQAGTCAYPIADWYARRVLRRYLVQTGVRFLSSYQEIYTTRLHAAILSTLLHKPFTLLNNSYGKNAGFYETWLSDLKGSRLLME
ncbi:MAG: polysaccharide pyruvyl transferase family protein [Prevotellaceae bacterium]|jgi:pyruvyl transferase EpsO|nr:polysaccharide pyruvyl transferase family protein [Prevotellaceae bacterium]